MLLNGEWSLDPDGVRRPVIRAEVLTSTGTWEPVELLVDTGADRTVLLAGWFELLGFDPLDDEERLSGIGGLTDSVRIPTQLRFTRADGQLQPVNGPYSIFLNSAASDCSVLGRDVLNHFSVIVDRPALTVCLLTGRHRYIIQET